MRTRFVHLPYIQQLEIQTNLLEHTQRVSINALQSTFHTLALSVTHVLEEKKVSPKITKPLNLSTGDHHGARKKKPEH